MIPIPRRVASGSLAVVRNAQVRQVTRNALWVRTGGDSKNVTTVQHGGRGPNQTRGFSQTTPTWSAPDFVLQPKEKGGDAKNEDPPGRPEHAVISTFDLFSIGGPCLCPSLWLSGLLDVMSWRFSWSEQFTYRRAYAGWQHIHQRLEGFRDSGASACCLAECVPQPN